MRVTTRGLVCSTLSATLALMATGVVAAPTENSLAGVRLRSTFANVIKRLGKPNRIEIGEGSQSAGQTTTNAGAGARTSGMISGMPGPGGMMMAMGGPGGMTAPGGLRGGGMSMPGMGSMGTMPNLPSMGRGGSGPTLPGLSGMGPGMPGMTTSGAPGLSMGGGLSMGMSGGPGMGGMTTGGRMGGSSAPMGGMMGGLPMPGMPGTTMGGLTGPTMGGMSGPGGMIPGLGGRTMPGSMMGGAPGSAAGGGMADEGEVTWVYEKGLATTKVLFDKEGRVIQVQVYGYKGVTTPAGRVSLGDSYDKIVRVYGWPEAPSNEGGNIVARYPKRSNVAFQLSNKTKTKGMRVVAITVALTDKD